ncbi:hypothetical protein K438DRAFT_1601887 [Mycena galopus ATCC 62051]|nr:hypothetical protein K438DRAFT_1601887 [Mycena galopus ATCC 62051]
MIDKNGGSNLGQHEIDRHTQALVQHMQAANRLSLTNRLKRMGIRSADIGHLLRSTTTGILADVGE